MRLLRIWGVLAVIALLFGSLSGIATANNSEHGAPNQQAQIDQLIADVDALTTANAELEQRLDAEQAARLAADAELSEAVGLLETRIVALEALDLSGLEGRVTALETELGYVQTDTAELRSKVATMNLQIGNLTGDVWLLQNDVSALQSDVSTLQADVADNYFSVLELQSAVSSVDGGLVNLQDFVLQLETRLDAIEGPWEVQYWISFLHTRVEALEALHP